MEQGANGWWSRAPRSACCGSRLVAGGGAAAAAEALRALGPRGFYPKLYVDMALAAGTAAAMPPLPGPEAALRGELDVFLAEYLAPDGSDLVAADPPDLALPELRGGFLPRVEHGERSTTFDCSARHGLAAPSCARPGAPSRLRARAARATTPFDGPGGHLAQARGHPGSGVRGPEEALTTFKLPRPCVSGPGYGSLR